MTENPLAQPPRPTAIPAGWYPDPRGSTQRRWWDGNAWTHALETPPPVTPGYANLPGPTVSRAPSPSAPTVRRAIVGDAVPDTSLPTRRQLRDAAAVSEIQRQFAGEAPAYSMGPEVTATQQPQSSFAAQQFATAADPTTDDAPTHPQMTEDPAGVIDSSVVSTIAPAPVTEAPVHTFAQTFAPVPAAAPVSANTFAERERADVERSERERAESLRRAELGAAELEAQRLETVRLDAERAEAERAEAVRAEAARIDAARIAARAEEALLIERAERVKQAAVQRAAQAAAAAQALATPVVDQYHPFGMTPTIRTGTLAPPTTVSTAAAWLFSLLPAVFVGVEFGIATYLPEFYTPFSQGGTAFVLVIAAIALAFADRRQLTQSGHTVTASPFWIVFTPAVYLFARAVRTTGQTGRAGASWAPLLVFAVVAAAAVAAYYVTPMAERIATLFA
ncbi:hypothetical protein HD599_001068 [Conyzicola lurida]|uniref:DUF2510 domain-containing protein n=1 Tax=Conyzicola lurida TaxID=1172621 RepID=A0A841AMI7_9MICO|nr:DUF2510 domain-containing protein [Conyzicola lurida]MBB5842745.1 hypothetical protein [Conyzicola lurida]